jgi:hypothetical protein
VVPEDQRLPTSLADDLFEFENLDASKSSSHCISQANSSQVHGSIPSAYKFYQGENNSEEASSQYPSARQYYNEQEEVQKCGEEDEMMMAVDSPNITATPQSTFQGGDN